MARSTTRARQTEPARGQSGLRLRKREETIAALLLEQSQLLKRIAASEKKLALERDQQRDIAQAMFQRMQPLVSEHSVLVTEIHSLFRALLAEGRLSKSARKKVDRVYRWFNDSGASEPFDARPREEPGAPAAAHDDFDGHDSTDSPGSRVESAKHAGGQTGNNTLRSLFRRLAIALHPDLARQASEQQRRTDVMKEVTRAYEEGNLARLLEIEQLWLSGGKIRSTESDEAARCAELERVLRELKAQMKALESELRQLRKTSPLAQVFGSRRVSETTRLRQLDEMVAAASEELEPLRQLREFVRAFSERKISLAEFLRGPDTLGPEERDVADALLEFVMEGLSFDFEPPSGEHRNSKRRRKNQQEFDDIPF